MVVRLALGNGLAGRSLNMEEGERQEAAVYIGLRSADTAVVSLQVKSAHTHSQTRNGAQDPLERRWFAQQ